jgi:hypothetical protein
MGGNVRRLTNKQGFSLTLSSGKLLAIARPGIVEVPVDGGSTTDLVQDAGALWPIDCGSSICWTSVMSFMSAAIMRKDGAADPVVVTQSDSLGEAHDLIFDGRNFFVTAGAGGGLLYRVPAEGGQPLLLAINSGLTALAMDDTCIYWSSIDGIFSLSREAADAANGSGF